MDRDFEQTILQHQDTVLACLYAVVRDRQLAEDLLQETFVVAWARRSDLPEVRDVGAWLRTVARHRAYRALSRERTRPMVRWLDDGTSDEVTGWEGLDAMEPMAAQLDALRECRKALSPQQQRVLALFYEGGKSGEEVADVLGVKRRTVFETLYVARKSLLECIRRRLRQSEDG